MRRLRKWWTNIPESTRWRVLSLGVLILGAVIPSTIAILITRDWPGLLLNFGTEMGGAVVTFILIDMIVGRYEQEEARRERTDELRDQLIRKLGSSVNAEARRAAEQLRALGWLTDGSLEEVELIGANLDGVDLRGAVLRKARMYRASLRGARLYQADFSGAILTGADLTGAKMGKIKLDGAFLAGVVLKDARQLSRHCLATTARLKGAVLPDGSRYDGCYCLKGDLEHLKKHAEKNNQDVNDPVMIAAWFGIEVEIYEKGQKWAATHLESVRQGRGDSISLWPS